MQKGNVNDRKHKNSEKLFLKEESFIPDTLNSSYWNIRVEKVQSMFNYDIVKKK